VLKVSPFLIFYSSFSTEDNHSPKLTVCQEPIGKIAPAITAARMRGHDSVERKENGSCEV